MGVMGRQRGDREREKCTILVYFCFEIFGGLCEGIKREMRVFFGGFFYKGEGINATRVSHS